MTSSADVLKPWRYLQRDTASRCYLSEAHPQHEGCAGVSSVSSVREATCLILLLNGVNCFYHRLNSLLFRLLNIALDIGARRGGGNLGQLPPLVIREFENDDVVYCFRAKHS